MKRPAKETYANSSPSGSPAAVGEQGTAISGDDGGTFKAA